MSHSASAVVHAKINQDGTINMDTCFAKYTDLFCNGERRRALQTLISSSEKSVEKKKSAANEKEKITKSKTEKQNLTCV